MSSSDVTMTPGRAGSAVATALAQGFFGLAFQAANFASLLNFLETQGNVQVLSSPRIATINNQKAVLKVGTDDFFVTNVSSTVTSTGTSSVTTPTITLQPYFSGIALDVTPQIDGENNIVLHVHPSISNVTESQKAWLYAHCAAFLFPSLMEGFGLPPIEAMFFGKPVVVARRTCLPEVCGEGAAYWDDFEPHRMRQVVEARLQAHQQDSGLAQRVRQQAQRYTWPHAAARYLALYEQLTQEATAC